MCDECGGYLKVSAAFSPTPVELLPVEDLATVHLDYIAQERGYARVQLSERWPSGEAQEEFVATHRTGLRLTAPVMDRMDARARATRMLRPAAWAYS